MDAFLGELIEEMEDWDEPVVLVLYGDHLPALGIEDEDLRTGDMYQTSYVIWNNFGLDMQGGDLQAFQLSAYVLGQLGIENGVLNRFHQNFGPDCEEEDYITFLRVLGNTICSMANTSFTRATPPMSRRICAWAASRIVCEYYTYDPATATISVYGENFTTYSDILVDGQRRNAVFADETRLIARANVVDGGQRGPAWGRLPAKAKNLGARVWEKCVKFLRNALFFGVHCV